MAKFVVDAHALYWFLSVDSRLGKQAEAVLADPNSELVLPAIAFAEVVRVARKRSKRVSTSQIVRAIELDSRIAVEPLSFEIVVEAEAISEQHGLEMHDSQIVATVRLLGQATPPVTLISKDEVITAARLVPTLW